MTWLLILAVGAIVLAVVLAIKNQIHFSKLSQPEKDEFLRKNRERQEQINKSYAEAKERGQAQQQRAVQDSQYGPRNSAMVCPHCHQQGKIRTKQITQKKGVSGSKATAAVVTGGLSILAVGLSRKEGATQAHCDSCKNTWLF